MRKSRTVLIIAIIFTIIIFSIIGISMSVGSRIFSNRAWFDTTYSYEYGQVKLPDGTVVKGKITRWLDFEDGDQIEVTIDGKTYLTHILNACLISD